jgi:hypothetical protein
MNVCKRGRIDVRGEPEPPFYPDGIVIEWSDLSDNPSPPVGHPVS